MTYSQIAIAAAIIAIIIDLTVSSQPLLKAPCFLGFLCNHLAISITY